MTDTSTTTSTPSTPKLSNGKKLFWAIVIILSLLAIDHYTFKIASGNCEATTNDSTVVVTPLVDSTVVVAPVVAVADTTKVDTTKK